MPNRLIRMAVSGLALAAATSLAAGGAGTSLTYPQLLPGQYTETMQFVELSENAPADLARRFSATVPKITNFCFRRDAGDLPARSVIEQRAGRGCEAVSAEVTGDQTKGSFKCQGAAHWGLVDYAGTFSPTRADLILDTSINSKEFKQPILVKTKLTLERVAENCPE